MNGIFKIFPAAGWAGCRPPIHFHCTRTPNHKRRNKGVNVTRKVVIVRGVLGAGKSDYIKACCPGYPEEDVIHQIGFSKASAGNASPAERMARMSHPLRELIDRMRCDDDLIIVEGTFLFLEDVSPYVHAGYAYGYETKVVTILADLDDCVARLDATGNRPDADASGKINWQIRNFQASRVHWDCITIDDRKKVNAFV